MALVVFLRGVNVGGHRTFQPKIVAKDLADFDVVNVGAAGTFVVRAPVSQARLRAEILGRLPFQADVMICPGRALLDLAAVDPLSHDPACKDARAFISVLARRPVKRPPLPLHQPAGANWQVKILEITSRWALSLWRRLGKTIVYPNAVVEKHLEVPATTRNWNTVAAICTILNGS
jgi:uncharacterized protein (DUF1697 family)